MNANETLTGRKRVLRNTPNARLVPLQQRICNPLFHRTFQALVRDAPSRTISDVNESDRQFAIGGVTAESGFEYCRASGSSHSTLRRVTIASNDATRQPGWDRR
jgi:hypothetical protein